MGRKSSAKGKEKRQKRKEEAEKVAKSQQAVDDANKLDDPLAQLAAFKKYDRNGLTLSISCLKRADVDLDTLEWAFSLTKANMQTLYEASDWGWSDKQKKDEMFEDEARYLIARNEEDQPVAVVHFRFDIDEEIEVLYCYEIQLSKEVRRKGLGKFLMQILELLAFKTKMQKVMLTAFVHNKDAQEFFKKTLKYEVDDSSPEETYAEAMYDEDGYTYEILSKHIGPKKAVQVAKTQNGTAAHNGHCLHGCC